MKYVLTIWWWTWTFNLVSALKKIDDVFINTLVTMSDDGWSTWTLRDEYGILPPWDIRRALVALADDQNSKFLRELFSYRFENWFLAKQSLWNLIMFAAEKITNDYRKALNELEHLFHIKKWKVYPSTIETTRLLAQLENDEYIIWETNIDIPKHDWNIKIKDFWVIKEKYGKILMLLKDIWEQDETFYSLLEKAKKDKPTNNPSLKEVLQKVDYIIFWPGDLYTSILPNLLVWDTIELIKNSKAKKIYIWNLFTKFWETNSYKLSDFLNVFKKCFWEDIFDYILVQDEAKLDISSWLLKKYAKEWKEFIGNDIDDKRIIKKDLVSFWTLLRHDIKKLSDVLNKIIK